MPKQQTKQKEISEEIIEERTFHMRGRRVMIDRDLAEFYGVETKYLNRQVKRNAERFPKEFMIRLTAAEKAELVTNWHRFRSLKHSKTNPHAFTENGVAMLASVLNSKRAVRVSIYIVKTFIKFRELISENREILYKLRALEDRTDKHDVEIKKLFDSLRHLVSAPASQTRRLGFR